MVEDKTNKMRESLSLMSLSSFSYALSYFILQGCFAAIAGIVLGVGMINDSRVFPDDPTLNPIIFGAASLCFGLAQIPYCMALSTLFSDTKLAN